MEDLGCMWSYQESIDDLKQKLLYTSLELETIRMEATEEKRKNEENVKHLLNLLKLAYKERDEAIEQLQKLMNKLFPPSSSPELVPIMPQIIKPESPLLKPTKANSTITESNSFSYHSHNSSPGDSSFFEPVSSPEFSNINNMAESGMNIAFMNQPLVQDFTSNASLPPPCVISSVGAVSSPEFSTINNMTDSTNNIAFVDQPLVQDFTSNVSLPPPCVISSSTMMKTEDQVIDDLSNRKPLPENGKFLNTVLKAGPLLKTLLVSGPLPRWRNPPPLQPFKIPPVSIQACESAIVNKNQKPAAYSTGCGVQIQRPLNSSSPFVEMSCGSAQMMSNSVLNFSGGGPSGSCLSNGWQSTNNEIPFVKRQRLH